MSISQSIARLNIVKSDFEDVGNWQGNSTDCPPTATDALNPLCYINPTMGSNPVRVASFYSRIRVPGHWRWSF